MSAPLPTLALSAALSATIAMSTASARAAELAGGPPSLGRPLASTSQWSARPLRSIYPRHAPGELIAGVRGGTPLTVPFFGSGWYPGPVHYYGTGICCHWAEGTV